MKNNSKDKSLFRRYLDNLYTTEDARKVMDGLCDATQDELLEELASDVWEESSSEKPFTDLEREQYKKEAQLLLKRIEHRKRTWFRRIAMQRPVLPLCSALYGVASTT